jgi:hypothetical protein
MIVNLCAKATPNIGYAECDHRQKAMRSDTGNAPLMASFGAPSQGKAARKKGGHMAADARQRPS